MLTLIYLLLLGLIVGSFLNCVIFRLEKKESFLRGRSYCPACHHQLSWRDLVPVLSYISLSGKCRYCKKGISIQYPIVELATAALFLLVFWHSGFQVDLEFEFLILISTLSIIIFVYDLKHYIIPDRVVFPAIFLALIFDLQFFVLGQFSTLSSAIIASGLFLLIFLVSKGKWLGFGDVKLVFLMGLILGFPNILAALFLAFFIGGIIGIGLIIAGKKGMKSEIPFGPFLITGTFLAIFFGQNLINWYLNLLT
ncbi:MAG: prepilin peptidase [Candidatus Staskawiczbacteria bacterium]|jgi:prepilin signal peptidase PulO-like enzyme (type II secretory pathway)